MFKIKICGITTPEDALLAADAGADAIGLNLHRDSPRYARRSEYICGFTPPGITRVGVFVNQTIERVADELRNGIFDAIQLHGDEPPAYLEQLSLLAPHTVFDQFSVIRAFRCPNGGLASIASKLSEFDHLGCKPSAVLLDAYDPNSYGGTGKVLNWQQIELHRNKIGKYPLILAGGLTPDNVAQAIATARPDAVDVASGVESSPGKKDPSKVRDFVAAAKEAFARMQPQEPSKS